MLASYSIIIPIYNSKDIDKQILSISELLLDNIYIEIIFVDDGSDKVFRSEYLKYIGDFNINNIEIKYLYLGNKNGYNRVNLARNRGTFESTSQNIIFIDQETIFHKNFINYFSNNSKKIIIGPNLGYNNLEKRISNEDIVFFTRNGYINKGNFQDFRTNFYDEKTKNNRIWEFLCGSNLFIKKNIFNEIGGFDEKIVNWGDEDVEFGYRLHQKGYEIFFDENLKVLNISDKLYKEPFMYLSNENIGSLTSNFLNNYKKHNCASDYKQYILDRFFSFDYTQKIKTDLGLKNEILKHNFYANKRKKVVLFRLDDVKELTINFKKILKIFIKYNIPLVLAIEPGNIDKETIFYINIIKQKYPDLIDIVQHGYKHINKSNEEYKYEFGENTDISKQFIDIKKGTEIMVESFGDNFFKAFVPPYNNINLDTENVLENLDFKVLSSGYPYENYLGPKNIVSVPFYLDIINNYNPTIFKEDNTLYNEISNYLSRDGFVGILLHPQFFGEDSFRLLIKVLEYLKTSDIDYSSLSLFYKNYGIDVKR